MCAQHIRPPVLRSLPYCLAELLEDYGLQCARTILPVVGTIELCSSPGFLSAATEDRDDPEQVQQSAGSHLVALQTPGRPPPALPPVITDRQRGALGRPHNPKRILHHRP